MYDLCTDPNFDGPIMMKHQLLLRYYDTLSMVRVPFKYFRMGFFFIKEQKLRGDRSLHYITLLLILDYSCSFRSQSEVIPWTN